MLNCTFFARLIVLTGIVFSLNLLSRPAIAQEPYIGEIRMFGFNFCPIGWTETNGQLLPIIQNEALFSLLGTIYGGDGRTTFGLPDLRGRVPIAQGQSPASSSDYPMGQMGGVERIAPSSSNPTSVAVSPGSGEGDVQVINELGFSSTEQDNRQPYLVVRYCIALQGLYPPRN